MRFRSTAVHALDDQPLFGTVSNSRAMKCTMISQCWKESNKEERKENTQASWSLIVLMFTFLRYASHHKSWNMLLLFLKYNISFKIKISPPPAWPPPPLAVQCCQTNRPWVCWRMVKVQRPCSGYKCSSSWAALTPTSSSTAMSRSATTPQACANRWVS